MFVVLAKVDHTSGKDFVVQPGHGNQEVIGQIGERKI